MRLNPNFKSFLKGMMTRLDTFQSDANEALKLLHMFKKLNERACEMGLENMYDLPSKLDEIIEQYENMERRLRDLQEEIERSDL